MSGNMPKRRRRGQTSNKGKNQAKRQRVRKSSKITNVNDGPSNTPPTQNATRRAPSSPEYELCIPVTILGEVNEEILDTDLLIRSVREKQEAISDLLKSYGGCIHSQVADICDADNSFKILVTFNSLEGFNKFASSFRQGNLSYWYFNLSYLLLRLQELLLDENVTPPVQKLHLSSSNGGLDRAVQYLTHDRTAVKLRDDLPQGARQDDINWKLWVYAKRGDPHKVQECIDLGADVNYYGQGGTTVLCQAVQSQSKDTCKVLLQTEGVEINAWTQYGQPHLEDKTAFLLALEVNTNQEADTKLCWEICQLLIEYKADVHVDNERAFYIAVTTGNYEACKELIEKHHVPVDTRYKKGQTALFACLDEKVHNLLLKHEASVHIVDQDGLTPLQFVLTNYPNLAIMESLIEAKSDVNKTFPDGESLFTHALKSKNSHGFWKSIINGGLDVEMKDENGYTALFVAVAAMKTDVAKELLDHGANISAKDKIGNSVLHVWALNAHFNLPSYGGKGCIDLFQNLLKAGACDDLEYKNKDGCTVTHMLLKTLKGNDSTSSQTIELSKFEDIFPNLLSPYMIETLDKNGYTLLHIAARYATPEACQLLINRGAKVNAGSKNGDTPLHMAAHGCINCLLKAGADLLAVNERFETPLHHLAPRGGRFTSLFQAAGAFVNAKDIDQNTPLHAATKAGAADDAIDLIKAGANLYDANKDGQTPLHHAAVRPKEENNTIYYTNEQGQGVHESMVDVILHKGGTCMKINEADKDGNTPLHFAAKVKNEENCIKLMNAGANALIKNKAGEQPLDLYGDQKPKELVELVQKQIKENLMLEGETKLDTVKVLLLGEPEAGKTTLTNALTGKEDEDQTYTPTAGIDIDHFSLEGAGNFSIWDCAGHKEFHVTHSLFLGGETTIYLVVYDLSVLTDKQKGKEYYEKLKYWLSFAKAGSRPREDAKPIVLLVGTHLDQVSTETDGKEAAEKVLQALQKLFKESLNIGECIVALNCKEKDSEEMSDLKTQLGECGIRIKENTMVPTLCEDIKTSMTSWCSPQYPVLTLDTFSQKMRKALHPRITDDWMGNAIKYLEYMGQTYTVQARNKKEKLVVVNLKWLCSKVIAQAFATEDGFAFMEPLEQKSSYTIEDFRKQFASLSDHIDDVVALLKELDLIFEVEDNRFIMPVKLTQSRKHELWQEDPSLVRYYGRRIECRDVTDIFSADVFPCFQVAMMKKYSRESEKPVISLNELKISQTVEGFVELIPDMRAIQYYVRGRGQEQQDKCHDMLKDIEAMITKEFEERSPGTYTTKKYLSSTEIRKLKDLEKVRSYTQEQLNEAVERNGIVHHKDTHNTDVVADIVCKGYDMMFLKERGLDCKLEWGMTKQAKQRLAEALDTRRYTRDDYRSLAEACGIPENCLEQMEQHHTQGSSMTSAVLDEWCKGGSHTVGELLHILCFPGLVDNDNAKRILTGMIGQFGLNTQEGGISPGMALEVLACRAALRRSSQTLCSNVQPDTLLDHLHHCFPEKTAEKLQQSVKTADMFTGMEKIITELLKLKKPTWWDELLKGASHVATNLQDLYRDIVNEHEIFRNLRSQQKSK